MLGICELQKEKTIFTCWGLPLAHLLLLLQCDLQLVCPWRSQCCATSHGAYFKGVVTFSLYDGLATVTHQRLAWTRRGVIECTVIPKLLDSDCSMLRTGRRQHRSEPPQGLVTSVGPLMATSYGATVKHGHHSQTHCNCHMKKTCPPSSPPSTARTQSSYEASTTDQNFDSPTTDYFSLSPALNAALPRSVWCGGDQLGHTR
jgi:hypothetical protein